MATRRDLLRSALAALALPLAAPLRAATPRTRAPTMLVLGGTGFLGPHIVEAAVRRGWQVTLFNRGKTNPGMFLQLERLVGDRAGDLHGLVGRQWDAVVDTSGNLPSEVRRAAELLAANVQRYLFLSSTAVYAPAERGGQDESAPVLETELPADETLTEQNYGAFKVQCERAAEQAMPGRTIALRSGMIVGPGDPTDRFTYWPVRAKRGGEMLCPGAPGDAIQLIDARDLAQFALHALERKLAGAYNIDSQIGALAMGRLVEASRAQTGGRARATWVPASFLAQQGLAAQELPVWIAGSTRELPIGQFSAARAKAEGLQVRPLEQTVRDTLAWFEGQPVERREALRAGLAPAREAELLRRWRDSGARA